MFLGVPGTIRAPQHTFSAYRVYNGKRAGHHKTGHHGHHFRKSAKCGHHKRARKKPQSSCALGLLWRKRWDSNPRTVAGDRISSAARYDHFDTLPCNNYSVFGASNTISSAARYDHFDTSPYRKYAILRICHTISSQSRYDHFDTAPYRLTTY